MTLPSLVCSVQIYVDGWVNPDNGVGFWDVVHDVNDTIFKDPSHISAQSSSYGIVPSFKPLQNEAKPRRVGALGSLAEYMEIGNPKHLIGWMGREEMAQC